MSPSFMTEVEATCPVIEELAPDSNTLILVFGGIKGAMGMPTFEFYKSTSILNQHRIFFRDLSQHWYHSGLGEITNNIDQTKDYIHAVIDRIKPTETIFVGNSMGGYAAILFSTLLNLGRVVAFSPQTFISPLKKIKAGDFRWKSATISTYLHTKSKPKYYDLLELLSRSRCDNPVDLHVSSFDRLDMLHAANLASFANVKIHTHALGGHNLVRHLRDNGSLREILLNTCSNPVQ